MKKLLFTSIIFAFFALSVVAQTNTSWETFKSKSQFQLEEQFRYYVGTDKASQLDYEHTDIQYKFLASPYWDVFGSYRLILKTDSKGVWDNYNMFVPGFDLKLPTQKWGTLNLRTKVEITPEQHSMTETTFNQAEWLKYNLPWKWTKYKINPFVGDEVFFAANHEYDFRRNRVTAGVDFQIAKNVKGTLMYWYQDDKNTKTGDWKASNYIVAQFKFLF